MAENPYTPDEDRRQIALIDELFNTQRGAYNKDPYPTLSQRRADLRALKKALLSSKEPLLEALNSDFGCRARGESTMAEILPTISTLNYTLKHLKKWMRPCKRHISPLFQPARGYVLYQPLGVVGIITPWNYPLFLALTPLITALAAGNRVMIKMSEYTPHTNKVIAQLLDGLFERDKVTVITGGPEVGAHFARQNFDHLLFTGSTAVGQRVMAAAAENLTPVTLELGGKTPALIDDEINIEQAVARLIFGKTLNAGQTCVAPDYILAPRARIEELIKTFCAHFQKMYPNFASNDDYSAIINDAQYKRLQQLLADARQRGAEIRCADDVDNQLYEGQRKIALTLISNINDDMELMRQEIFGPLLPIVGYDSLDEAISYINAHQRPLALYLCSHNPQLQRRILQETHAGGVCINEATLHVAQDDLPFGGIGPSGMGSYHGHEGFTTFSHAKAVLHKGRINSAALALPPYGRRAHRLIEKLFIR